MTMQCPKCRSIDVKKNGFSHVGKQNYYCHSCTSQFVEKAHHISEEQKAMVRNLLLERISLRGICRATKVSLSWLLWFMKKEAALVPDNIHTKTVVEADNNKVIALEIDELWTFVGTKAQAKWIWLVMDKVTRQILAYYVGPRNRESLQELLNRVPEEVKKRLSPTQIIF